LEDIFTCLENPTKDDGRPTKDDRQSFSSNQEPGGSRAGPLSSIKRIAAMKREHYFGSVDKKPQIEFTTGGASRQLREGVILPREGSQHPGGGLSDFRPGLLYDVLRGRIMVSFIHQGWMTGGK
jgi:hypothetical protein